MIKDCDEPPMAAMNARRQRRLLKDVYDAALTVGYNTPRRATTVNVNTASIAGRGAECCYMMTAR